jgi:hypothetical protein
MFWIQVKLNLNLFCDLKTEINKYSTPSNTQEYNMQTIYIKYQYAGRPNGEIWDLSPRVRNSMGSWHKRGVPY